MRTLALSDEILMKVDKAARYIGGEVNSVMKDKNAVDIRFAMCFPDVYEIGMSNLGMMILYNMFNQREDVWCERLFSPWPDLDKVMREEKIPLFALESQEPIRDFDFLGITIGYEMCYTNILQVLDLSGIPLKSADRGEDFPIVIGGGACAYNPEPLAPFFDMFYIGEGETVYDALFDAYKANKKAGGSRKDFLLAAAKIPGIYVPSLYEVTYKEDGTIASFAPTADGVPEKVQKQLIIDMEKEYRAVEAPVVPHIKATQDRVTLEIQRGCIRGCRFCQAGMIYRPTRDISDNKAAVISIYNSKIRTQRCKMIVGDLRLCICHTGKKGRFTNIRKSYQTNIRDHFKFKENLKFLSRLSRLGIFRYLHGSCCIVLIAFSTTTAF